MLLRSAGVAAAHSHPQFASSLVFSRQFVSKSKSKSSSASKNNKGKEKAKESRSAATVDEAISSSSSDLISDGIDDVFDLPRDPLPLIYDPALDVGPNGRPLFTFADSFASINHKNTCTYMDYSLEEWRKMLPEGLPLGLMKEFEESRRCAVMVRQSFLDDEHNDILSHNY